MKLIKKKVIFLLALTAILSAFMYCYFFVFSYKPNLEIKKEITLAIVSDIHVGPNNDGNNESAVVHPNKYKINLKPLMNSRPDLILTLGDNVNDHDKCHPYADDLKLLFSRFNVLWGKGNHDMDCFLTFNNQAYYYHDYNNAGWRIILLDHRIDTDLDEQNWLRKTLKTDKKVVLVSHVPFFSPSRDENAMLPEYVEVEKIVSGSGNVKYVLSGHLHNRLWDKIYNGVHYYIIPSVSGDGYPKYFMKLTLN
jgi:hypothetical protein